MRIKLSPQLNGTSLTVRKAGNTLTLNGEVFDFSFMTEGSTLPRLAIGSDWFADDVHMENGELRVTLLFPIPGKPTTAQAFPEDLVDVPDGEVVLP
ncbi:hypothetical protein ABQX22_18175 [Xanthomonas sp. WHRI 1810A]|uniref:hypothetical protein n=1 Tax=Xanthomonas sp. WHRI 1810A TaxID=3161565 RepID=UPI0032E85044